jgi:solute carrier family 24 (sodium/potassium/calcium exchanger), member 5
VLAIDDDSKASCEAAQNEPTLSPFVKDGGFLILIMTSILSLYGMAYVCEEFFCHALEVFCRRWNVPDSVAGSLVMAAGNDAPEIFISFLGIFVQKSAIGIGTVVGSEIFNHMCISAGSCLYAKNGVLQLNGRHFTRDSIGYCASLVILLWAVGANPRYMFDESAWLNCLDITFTGSLVLIICQIIYCVFVVKFESLCERFGWKDSDFQPVAGGGESVVGASEEVELVEEGGESASMLSEMLSAQDRASSRAEGDSNSFSSKVSAKQRALAKLAAVRAEAESPWCGLSLSGPVRCVAESAEALWEIVTYPLRVSVQYTVPNPHDESWEPYYWLTITLCTCWFAVFAFALCECLDRLGAYFGISSVVMGITFSAVGTSFPNLWSSLVVARQGKGDMAISNALGSNTFNIFTALGLPWIVYCYTIGDYRSLQDGGIILLTLMLLVIMVIYYVVIMLHGWRIYDW